MLPGRTLLATHAATLATPVSSRKGEIQRVFGASWLREKRGPLPGSSTPILREPREAGAVGRTHVQHATRCDVGQLLPDDGRTRARFRPSQVRWRVDGKRRRLDGSAALLGGA